MKSLTLPEFWACFYGLPLAIQQVARRKHKLWLKDPAHPSLRFKKVSRDVWSVRINDSYRALGRRPDDDIIWFWIGSHAEYDQMLS